MLRFVWRKLLNKKWMALSLLIGDMLLIAIAISNPLYAGGMLQKVLTRQLSYYLTEKNAYPGLVYTKINAVPQRLDLLFSTQEQADSYEELYGVPSICRLSHYSLNQSEAKQELVRSDKSKNYVLGFLSDLPDHIRVTAGRVFSPEPDKDGVVDVMVSERGMLEMDLLLDEIIVFPKLPGPTGDPLRVRVAGAFTNGQADDPYWVESPSSFKYEMFLPESVFRSLFILTPDTQRQTISAQWYTLLDYTAMKARNAEHMLSVTKSLFEAGSGNQNIRFRASFEGVLTQFLHDETQIRATLTVLEAPILMLLVAFVFMVSRQLLHMEHSEIAVLKSRGAGRLQILGAYFTQSLVVGLLALLLALPLSVFLCQVVGSANAFMEFVQRSALEIHWDKTALLYAGSAFLLCVLTMTLPVIRYSRVSIVTQKQKKRSRSSAPLWQKLFIDVILLGVALYGLYTFYNQQEILAQRVLSGESLDPLLYLSSSLFMTGAALLCLRVIPAVVWCVYRLLRRLWSPALYASFLRVIRERNSHGFIMVFLMLTIALGMFNAQTARTVNTNKELNTRYVNGADLVFTNRWNSVSAASDTASSSSYFEPDFSRYTSLDGAESVTRVQVNTNVSAGSQKDVTLMAIHTRQFGETAYFPDGLTQEHWYNLLNLISQDSSAVLLSRSFETNHHYKVGDTITYKLGSYQSIRGTVYGFVDYFPGFSPVVYKSANGRLTASDNYLIVAHLSRVQADWGVTPYQVWMKAKGSTQFLYDFAQDSGTYFVSLTDTSQDLIAAKNDPIFQGTNGILTIGFIVALVLCAAGFLIYWVLSIRERTLQFGIYRAMGLTLREIFTMLLGEQICISGLSVAAGVLIGTLATRLYIPLIQIAYTAADQALPMTVYALPEDTLRLLIAVGGMMLLCMLLLGLLISRMRIAQALKLGED